MQLQRWYRLATLLLLPALVAGCATTLPPVTTGPNGTAPTMTVPYAMPVVVSVAGYFDGASLPGLDQKIATFEAANPDVMVELVKAPAAEGERQAAFADALGKGDSSTDVYVVDAAWLAGFTAKGWLQSLDGYASTQGAGSSVVDANRVGGHLMGLAYTSGESLALSAYSGVPDQAFRVMAYLAAEGK